MNEQNEFVPKYVFYSEKIGSTSKGTMVMRNCSFKNIQQTQDCYFGIVEGKDGELSIYMNGVTIMPTDKNTITVKSWISKVLRFLRLGI